ncbi:neuropilin-2-like [Hyperolius riggenbachi]|uniref:neuropilin-2-like n=1 Tax=Hyperolius riggenbachi TaxID=752182 RepID=UPI0035A2A08A
MEQDFPGNTPAFYVISAPPGYKVFLNFSQFVCLAKDCSDKINIYDGVNKSAALLATVCINQPLPVLVSSSSFLLLEYITAAPGQSSFSGSYSSVKYGGTYTSPGYINSPSTPDSTPAVYAIIAPPGYKILLTFLSLNIKLSSKCTKASLVVKDVGSLVTPKSNVYCGLNAVIAKLTLTFSGRMVLLQFFSNSDANNSFKAIYNFTK